MSNFRNGSQNGTFFIVRAATTTNITLANLQTIDDVVLVAGDLVLVKDQTDQKQNGIYNVVDGGVWTRASNFNTSPKLYPGLFLTVMEGTSNKVTYWKLDNARPIVLNVDNIVFSQFGTGGGGGGGIALSAGTQVATTGTVRFSNSNGLTFGMSNSSVITGSYTVPSIAGLISAVNVSAGTTSNNLSNFVFSNSNNVSFGLSGSTITASVIPPTTANVNFSAGTTSNNLSAITFSNSNGLSFGLNGSTITGSYTVPTQTNQTVGLYGLGNTTQNSSTTLDARSLSFNGLGDITVGYSNGSIQVSGTQTIQTQNVVVPSAGTQTATSGTVIFSNSNNITFGMSGSNKITASYNFNVSAGTTSNNLNAITFSNANGLSFGLDASTITASYTVPIQSNQTEGLYAVGNTTGQSSSSTFDARTLSVSGAGIASVGYSAGNLIISVPSAGASINFSAGTTSNNLNAITFSNSNNVSFGLNGSTLTASIATSLTNINISAGTTSNNLSALTFANSNNVSFGINASTITASIPLQSNQTIGLYGLGNTTQNSSTTLDARSLSFNGLGIITLGYSNGSIQVSATQSAQTQNIIQAVYDGANSITTGTVRFSNSNGISFGINGQTITASHNGITSQTNQTVGLYALGNTTQNSSTTLDARTLSFNGLGIITAGYSNGSIQLSATQSAQTQNVVVPSAGTQTATSGTVVWSNSNNITFGMSGSSNITASYNFNVSGGTTSNNLNAITFSNANGVTFGLNGSTLTASVVPPSGATINVSAGTTSNNLTAITFADSNGLAFGLNGSTITGSYTVPVQSAQTVGLYGLGNTTQNSSTTLDARSLSFNGNGIITVGYSNGSIQLSATTAVQTNQTVGLYALGNTTQNSSTTLDARSLSFNGLGIITAGYSNGSIQISATTAQSNQTIGGYAVGNTTGQSSSSTFDARTLSFSGAGIASVGYSAGQVIVSVPSAGASVNFSAGTTSNNLNAVTFANSNGLAFGLNGSTITGSYTVPVQTNQTVGLYALGNTTQNSSTTLDARTLSFNGLGIVTVGYSNGSIQVSATTAAQTNQTVGLYALGNTTQNSSTTLDARSLSFNGLGAATVGYSNGSIQISVPNALTNINISAGTTSNNLTALTFSNANNVSFGLNGSTLTASIPTQTNQTVGLYALGNTTQNSSTTLDARSLSFNGLGIITAGYSNGSIQISATTAAQTNQTVGFYAVGNTTQNSSTTLDARTVSFNGLGAASVGFSNGSVQVSVPVQTVQTQSLIQAIYDGANSITTGTIRVSNLNGVSFGINGQTLTASVAAQTNQTVGLYALGNTTQNSSTTLDARTLSFNGNGIVSVGYSNGSIQISAPNFKVSHFAYPNPGWVTNFVVSDKMLSLQHVFIPNNITASQMNLLMALTGNTDSTGALSVSLGIFTMSGSTLSLASSDSRQISWTSGSQTTNSTVYGGISGTRYRTVSLNNWNITRGDYILGMWFRTTNNGSWRAFGQQGPTIVGAVDANETNHYLNGYSTSTFSTAMVNSVNVTDTNFVRTGDNALQHPGFILLGSF